MRSKSSSKDNSKEKVTLDQETSTILTDSALHLSRKTKQNTLEEEKNLNTIFVGNLPNTVSPKDLKKLFRPFGKVLNARIRCAVRKELKIPKKLAVIKKEFHEDSKHINAYIKFQEIESCKSALKMNGQLFEGHHLRVNMAGDETKHDSKQSIFVGNLSYKLQDDELWEAFEDCGPISSVRVVRDEKTGIGKGFGYVNFKSADAVELAINLDGEVLQDRNIRVSRIDAKHGNKLKIRRVKRPKIAIPPRKSNKTVPESRQSDKNEKKTSVKTKTKNEFQGRKTKPTDNKVKKKKKKKLNKKDMVIKQIAKQISSTPKNNK